MKNALNVRRFLGGRLWVWMGAWLLAMAGAWESLAADPERVTQDEDLRAIDTVELFRNGIYWWSSSSCSGEIRNPGGASYLAYTDFRLASPGFTRLGTSSSGTMVSGGFQAGDALDLGISVKDRASALRGVLLPDCGYGAHFVRDDEAFYYAWNRQLHRKPLTALATAPGETIRFRVGLDRFPVAADGVLYATEREVWSYAADLPGNTLTIQRVWKPWVRDSSAPRDVLTLPGVAVRKFAIADIQAQDGSYLGSVLLVLLPDGSLYRAGVGGENATVIRRGVADFAIRNESYQVRGNLGLVSRRRVTTVYLALGNPVTHRGDGQLLGVDLTPGGRGEFVEYNAGPGFRVTSVAVDKGHLFLTRTPPGNAANSDLLRRKAPVEMTLLNPGDPNFSVIGLGREYRSLRSSGRMVYFAHGNTVQRLAVGAPSIEVDFEAFAIEATQAIQNLNNTVPLVAGKRVFVRGYARLNADTSRRGVFEVPGQLRVYHAPAVDLGQAPFTEVAGSPFLPVIQPSVVPVGSLGSARTNLAATFVFEVPEAVVRKGDLQFVFHLNPDRVVPETGDHPLANNSSMATLKVHETLVLPLTMVPLLCKEGVFDPYAPNSGFWNNMARAQSLLPFPGLRIGIRQQVVLKSAWEIAGTGTPSYDLPKEKDAAISAVDSARSFDGNPLGGPYVGMVHPLATNFGGYGRTPGQAMMARMATNSWARTPWNTLDGGITVAHEFGHNSGFRHIRSDLTCGSSIPLPSGGKYDSLPNGASPCTLGLVDLNDPAASTGFDPLSWTIPLPGSNGDLMSYAAPMWISEYNWKRLIESYSFRFPQPAGDAVRAGRALHGVPEGEVLVLHGVLYADGDRMDLQPVHLIPVSELAPAILEELTRLADGFPDDAPVRVELLDAEGVVLIDQPVPLQELSEGENHLVSRAIPMRETAKTLRFRNGAKVLLERVISPEAPVLRLEAPEVANGKLNLRWNAEDADGDAVLFTTQVSADDGRTWRTLRMNASEPRMELESAALPGGTAVRLRVLATDGVRSAIQTSDAFELPKHAPEARIANMARNQVLEFGTTAEVQGFGYDLEDGGLASESLQWSLSGAEVRAGVGGTFSLSNLAPGSYSLTLTATDADGQTATDTVEFRIRALAVTEGDEPALDGLCADPGYGRTEGVRIGLANGNYGRARFVHAKGALFVCFTGMRYGASDGTGAVAGLRIQPGNGGDGLVLGLGFGVTEHGELLRLERQGDQMVRLADAPEGFGVVILRDENSWSAEMRIADALLGGWDESFGLAVVADDGVPATPTEVWPPGADVDNPGTWAEGYPGVLPPPDPENPPGGGDLDLIVNGSFENTQNTFQGDAAGIQSLQPNSTAIPGWTVTSAELAWASNANPFGPTAVDGEYFLDLTGYHDGRPYGGVLQTLATVAGGRYRVSFAVGSYQDDARYQGPMSIGVEVEGTTHEFIFTPEPRRSGNQWKLMEIDFVATDAATRISIAGAAARGGGYLGLDEVSLKPVSEGEERLVNGGFEDTENSFVPQSSGVMSLAPGSTSIPGWEVVAAETAWASNANPFGPQTTFGNGFVDLTGFHDAAPYGGVAQTVELVPGQAYRLSFHLGSDEDNPTYRGPVAVTVGVGAESWTHEFVVPGSGNQWGTFSFDFTASSSSTPIEWVGRASEGGQYLGLDRVSVVRLGDEDRTLTVLVSRTADSGLRLSFDSIAGRTYRIESKLELSEANWEPMPGKEAQGTGGTVELLVEGALSEPQRFYRVREDSP